MKLLFAIQIVLLLVLIYLGFYFIEVKEKLLIEFFEVGWENYRGVSLRQPSNRFACFGLACAAFSVYLGWRMLDLTFKSGFLMMILGVGFCVFALIMLVEKGTVSVKESFLAWQIYVGIALLLAIVGFFEEERPNIRRSYHNNILDDF